MTMKKIIEYATVSNTIGFLSEFTQEINDKIKEGFQPYGYPTIAGASEEDGDERERSDFIIVQALVKYDAE